MGAVLSAQTGLISPQHSTLHSASATAEARICFLTAKYLRKNVYGGILCVFQFQYSISSDLYSGGRGDEPTIAKRFPDRKAEKRNWSIALKIYIGIFYNLSVVYLII